MKETMIERFLLLLTAILAAWQIVVGIDNLAIVPIIAYTIAFGALVVACLLLIILGWDVPASPTVLIAASVVPLSLSLGLVWQFLATWRVPYLIFVVGGLLAIALTRLPPREGGLPVIVLAVVHGVAGMVIVLLPIVQAALGLARPGFVLVSLGGALMGVGGLLLSFLRVGRPLLSRETILRILPGLLLAMTLALVVGFALA